MALYGNLRHLRHLRHFTANERELAAREGRAKGRANTHPHPLIFSRHRRAARWVAILPSPSATAEPRAHTKTGRGRYPQPVPV